MRQSLWNVLSFSLVVMLIVFVEEHAFASYQRLGAADGINYTWDGTYASRLVPETAYEYKWDYGNDASVVFALPWSFPFNSQNYTQITAKANGTIQIGGSTGPVVTAWKADLSSYFYGGLFVQRKFNPDRVVIEWRTETQEGEGYGRMNAFEVVLYRMGAIKIDYAGFDPSSSKDAGSSLSGGGAPAISLSAASPTGSVTALGGTSHLILYGPYVDNDSDGLIGLAEFRIGTNPRDDDTDDDAELDGADASPLVFNDRDGDKIPDILDPFPDDPNEYLDTDEDGIGNLADADDDGDGLSDLWELRHGYNPLVRDDTNKDEDLDGLSLYQEYILGTNPFNFDSDSDGISDYDEYMVYVKDMLIPIINFILLK